MPRHRGQASSPSPDDTRRTRRSRKARSFVHSTIEGWGLAILLWCSCTLAAACGGQSATQPDPSVAVPLTAGQQLLTLGGFSVSFDPTFPTCTPPGQPRDGTSVNTVVALTKEDGEWVARSAPGMGSVELRLRGTGKSVRGYLVSGTVTGSARDMGLMGIVRDVTVSLGSSSSGVSATFDGETASPSSSLIVGKVTGTVRFSDSQGQSSTCPQIQWSMQPY
jgi:hypothetical protein